MVNYKIGSQKRHDEGIDNLEARCRGIRGSKNHHREDIFYYRDERGKNRQLETDYWFTVGKNLLAFQYKSGKLTPGKYNMALGQSVKDGRYKFEKLEEFEGYRKFYFIARPDYSNGLPVVRWIKGLFGVK